MKLDKFQYKPGKGIVSGIREFLKQVSEDPSAVNEIHRDYLQKTEALKAQTPSRPEESAQKQAPEKTQVMPTIQ